MQGHNAGPDRKMQLVFPIRRVGRTPAGLSGRRDLATAVLAESTQFTSAFTDRTDKLRFLSCPRGCQLLVIRYYVNVLGAGLSGSVES